MKKKVLISMLAMLAVFGLAYAANSFQDVYGSAANATKVKKWLHDSPEQIAKDMGYTALKKADATKLLIEQWIAKLDDVDLSDEPQFVQKDIDNMKWKGGEAWNYIAVNVYQNSCGTLLNNWNFQQGSGTLFEKTEPKLKAALEGYNALVGNLMNGADPSDYMPNLGKELTIQYNIAKSNSAYEKLCDSQNAAGFLLRPWYKGGTLKQNSDMQSFIDYMDAWSELDPTYAKEAAVKTAKKSQGFRAKFLAEGAKMYKATNFLASHNVNTYFDDGNINKDIDYDDCKALCEIADKISNMTEEEGLKYIMEVYDPYVYEQLQTAQADYVRQYPITKAELLAEKYVSNWQAQDILKMTAGIYDQKTTECKLQAVKDAITQYNGLNDASNLESLNGGPLHYNDLIDIPWNCDNMSDAVGTAIESGIGRRVKKLINNAYNETPAISDLPINYVVDDAATPTANTVYATLKNLKRTGMIDELGTKLALVYTTMYGDAIKSTTYKTEETMVTKDLLETLESAINDRKYISGTGVTAPFKKKRDNAELKGAPKWYWWNNAGDGDIVKPETKPASVANADENYANGQTVTGLAITTNAKAKITAYMYGGQVCKGSIQPNANDDVLNGAAGADTTKTYGTLDAKRDAAQWMADWEDVDTKEVQPDGTTKHWTINATLEDGYSVNEDDKTYLTQAVDAYKNLGDEAKEYIKYEKYFNALKDILPAEVSRVEYYSHCFDVPEVAKGKKLPISLNAVVARLEELRIKELNLSKGAGANPVAVIYGADLTRDMFKGYEDIDLPANVIYCCNGANGGVDCKADIINLEMNAPYKVWNDVEAKTVNVTRKYAQAGARECLYLPFRVEGDNFDYLVDTENGAGLKLYAIGGAFVNDAKHTVSFGINAKGEDGDKFLAAYKPYLAEASEIDTLEFTDVTIQKTENIKPVVVDAANRVKFHFIASNDETVVNVGEYYLYADQLYKRAPKKDAPNLPNPTTAPAGTLVIKVLNGGRTDYVLGFEGDFDESTGIQEVNAAEILNGAIYNVNGQKVNTMNRPGIYVVNGKKVSVK